MHIRKLGVAAALAIAALAFAGCSASASSATNEDGTTAGKKVYFLLPNSTTTRFEARDKPAFIAAMKKYAPGAEVISENAQGDASKQQQQTEDAITQGAAAIVLVAADANLASGALGEAAKAKVPVVLYEHDAQGGPAAAQVLFDAHAVGVAQGKRAAELLGAMPGNGIPIARVKGNPGEYGTIQYEKGQDEYLNPLIKSGKVKVVCDKNITNWDPVAGQAFVEDCLSKTNNDVKLFITMNDGLAGGAIAALEAHGLAGKIPVTGGQNGDLNALQYIAQGKLDNTINKDIPMMADKAAQVTASILKGKGVPKDLVNGTIDNTYAKLPAVFLPVQNVTIDNLADAVKVGPFTWKEICQGAETTSVCKENLKN